MSALPVSLLFCPSKVDSTEQFSLSAAAAEAGSQLHTASGLRQSHFTQFRRADPKLRQNAAFFIRLLVISRDSRNTHRPNLLSSIPTFAVISGTLVHLAISQGKYIEHPPALQSAPVPFTFSLAVNSVSAPASNPSLAVLTSDHSYVEGSLWSSSGVQRHTGRWR